MCLLMESPWSCSEECDDSFLYVLAQRMLVQLVWWCAHALRPRACTMTIVCVVQPMNPSWQSSHIALSSQHSQCQHSFVYTTRASMIQRVTIPHLRRRRPPPPC